MSASREKKKRQGQDTAEVAVTPEVKKGMSKGTKKFLFAVVAIVLVAAIVFLGMVSSGFLNTHTTAGIANGHELTPAMLNYHYASAYQEMSSVLSYMVDTELPLNKQEYLTEDFETWHDYLIDFALNSAASTYAIYDEAVANGYTLTEDTQAALASEAEMLELYAMMSGYTSGDAYVAAMYGSGCNVENYLEFATISYTAQEYAAHVYGNMSFTQEEIDARYAADPDVYDSVSYYLFNLTAEIPEGEEAVSEEVLAQLEESAKAMADESKGNVEKFFELCVQNTDAESQEGYDPASTLQKNIAKAELPETLREWLSDEARQAGDTTYVFNTSNGYAVAYFVEQVDHNFQLPNVRHILVSADPSDAEAMATALEKAETLLNDFKAGEQTEDAFATLANENSEDTGSNTTGGLYENITPGSMVANFDAWCFDEARQIGDTDILESDYGYHVMYFSGYGEIYHNYEIETDMINEAYTQWQTEVTSDLTWELISDKFVASR